MRNLCNQPIWLGFSGGSAFARGSQSTTCGGDGDCPQGTHCVQTGPIRQCFWQNPQPADGNHKLETNESKTLSIPIYDDGTEIIWSGIITGRTNCNGATCETADCGGGDGTCKPGQGFQQPATQAEFTFSKHGSDFYDVEIINGIHLPVSFGPTNVAGGSSYKCGTPGAKNPKTHVGSCDWNFNPPNPEYNWVTMGGNTCGS